MADSPTEAMADSFVFVVVKRLAALLLPLGVGLGDFLRNSKSAYVAAAADHIRARGERVSTSRIAVITGLSRAEVAKIRSTGQALKSNVGRQRTERVMHGWFTDPNFVDRVGKPKSLPADGTISFDELVKRFGGDVPPRAVLRELIAGGMVQLGVGGHLVPIRRHYSMGAGPSLDLERLAVDASVFFSSASGDDFATASALRRLTVRFRGVIGPAVRRNVALRTERFLDGLSEYLHAAAGHLATRADFGGESIHVLVAQSDLDENAQFSKAPRLTIRP